MRAADALRSLLQRLDGRGYKAYRDLRGDYDLGDLSLHVDHVQGDPFAAPSKLRLRVPMDEARLPDDWRDTRVRRLACADLLARRVRSEIQAAPPRRSGSGKGGVVRIDAGGQEVLERTAIRLEDDFVEARIEVGLPAAGRRVLGGAADALLCDALPEIARRALRAEHVPADTARAFVACVENQEVLRARLADEGLLAVVGDGALLPRESGASDRPLRTADATPFVAPDSMRVELPLANPVEQADGTTRRVLRGLGIRRGVTLVVGGGYHGKSTLLRALERGVHPHVPGDGREEVVSDPGLVKIRAEDGRRVEGVDIRAFIRELPGGRSTAAFRSDDASGSTSQAANIVEAIEAGASGLLLDEDTSATNFMVRDARMQALVHRDDEPITPFVDRVRELFDVAGVSTVLVMGGCGDYFEPADRVLRMRDFRPEDATDEAKRIARESPSRRAVEPAAPFAKPAPRVPLRAGFDASRGRRDVKIDAKARDEILYGRESIDLRGLEQLVDRSQTRAIGHAIHRAVERWIDDATPLPEVLDAIEDWLDHEGLDGLDPFHRPDHHPGSYARPRRFEIAGAIGRLRTLRVRSQEETR
ncbi:MAG: ABC-ATPase domain-containing protein [Myxococcota bacterium]